MTEVIETVWIPMPDGIRLAARLWLPDGARGAPVPAILEYIPYRRRDRTRLRDESMHPHLAAAGYAALRVDMRGTGDSDGVMLDEYSDQEIRDGADVIAWIAAQPWCDGAVGMFGKSWGAYSAFQVAALRPPALKAIVPVMGTDDRWLEDIHFYGGVLAGDNFWWGAIMQLLNAMPPDPEIVGADRWRGMWRERLEAMTFWPAQWLEHQTHGAMWRRGSISEDYRSVNVPVFFVGGWADLFRDTPFRIARNLPGPVHILMGPWAHLYPHEGIPGPKADFIAETVRFWDHYLKGIDTGLPEEPRYRFILQDSAPPHGFLESRSGLWVGEDRWPSPGTAERTLWLNTDGLGPSPGDDAQLRICSPQTFGSAGGDMCSFAIPGDLPTDCRIDAAGALCFAGAPQKEALCILGQPQAVLAVAADRPQAFVAVLLADEAEDGAQTLIARGFANLMHRLGDTEPTPVVPGEEMTITVPLHGIGYRVAPGHRLVVQVASAYWPILWPAPEPVTLTVRGGRSALHLPVLENPRPVPPPPEVSARHRPEPPVTLLSEGSMDRSLTTDLTTGMQVSRFFLDGGVFGPVGRLRLDDTGTELGDISERLYRIHPNDPLSARATMEQESRFGRDGWQIRIKADAEMTATPRNFLLRASVTCWEGEDEFHHVDWNHVIPRNGM